MKSEAELKAVTQFVAEYATRLMGSGVHTSRVVRNTKRLGEALGVRVMVSAFQKVVTFSVYDDESGRVYSEVADIPPLPISFELNSELSALSWDACDLRLPLAEIRRRYDEIVARPRLDPIFTLILVGLANASFCRLFGGEWCAVGIVFTATLLGFYLKQRMQAKGFNHYVIFIASAFAASMYADFRYDFGGRHRHERALPDSGGAAYQRRDRHRRGACVERYRPPDVGADADRLHRRRIVMYPDDR